MKRFKSVFIASVVCFFMIMAIHAGNANAGAKQFVSIGTGNPSGTYYFLGAGFANIWNQNIPGIKVIAEATAASGENLALIARGKLDVAIIVSSTVADGVQKGMDLSNVRLLCSSLHGSHYQFVVRKESPIKTYKDFVGKRISFGGPGSGTLISSLEMIKAWGYKKSDFNIKYLSFPETIDALRDKTIDVGLIAAAAPVASIMDLASTVPIRLIRISHDQFVVPNKIASLYMDMLIPAGTYKGIDEDVLTQASPTFLIVSKKLSEELVYKLLKELYNHPKERAAIHNAAKEYSRENAFSGIRGNEKLFVPFHDGAIKYFKEQGMWPPKKK